MAGGSWQTKWSWIWRSTWRGRLLRGMRISSSFSWNNFMIRCHPIVIELRRQVSVLFLVLKIWRGLSDTGIQKLLATFPIKKLSHPRPAPKRTKNTLFITTYLPPNAAKLVLARQVLFTKFCTCSNSSLWVYEKWQKTYYHKY